ncbi:MAG: Transposase [uncultured Sulfurovum sp.]|uniref:Transposase n=1 Tax=uncultured Sulfurovum sp. TaxID=269237 RepID=A0A6S6U687_9BACT|nr:MAG: Transposase [uncultured Sulfurovum sp.]
MPRIARGETVGGIYHIINRGNMKMQVFDDAEDYEYFLELLEKGTKREKVGIHAYCLMPNHFHLLLVPKEEKSLSRLMQWVMTSHVRYYHKKNKTSGHIWQGRYKSFMVEYPKGISSLRSGQSYYLTLIRYIEANASRAKLVKRAEEWSYGSLQERVEKVRTILSEPYIELYDEWVKYVNQPLKEGELDTIRNSVNRQAPLGEEKWQMETATKYGMLSTLRRRGRPSLK